MDIQDREEAVALLTREDSTNVSLLLARPEIEVRKLDTDFTGRLSTAHSPENTPPGLSPPCRGGQEISAQAFFSSSEYCQRCVCSFGRSWVIFVLSFSAGREKRRGRENKESADNTERQAGDK